MDIVNSQEVATVQLTWDMARKHGVGVTAQFYATLFEHNPELRGLFPADMERQESSLLDMLDVTIGKLVNLEQLVPMLGRLGAEHAIAHHVTSDMYTAVGSALLETLRMVLGEAWTDEVRASWVKVYEIVQDVMIAGGDEALAAKRRAEFVSA